MDSAPTMKMVAEAAGVSTVTVSRALKNHPGLPKHTCLRIQEIAERMGYRPNPMVSVLMSSLRRSKPNRAEGDGPVIAFLYRNKTPEMFEDPSTPLGAMRAGASARAAALGYNLQSFRIDAPGLSEKRLRQILRARGITGVILAPFLEPSAEIPFEWSGLACATIGYSYHGSSLHRVVSDQFGTVQEALRRLASQGIRRVALVLNRDGDARTNFRWSGGYLSLLPHMPEIEGLPVFYREGKASEEALKRGLCEGRPEVIISPHNDLLEWLMKAGFSVPRDMGFVSLDVCAGNVQATGMNRRHDLIGATALDLVVEQLHLNEHGVPARPKTVTFMGDWVEGGTVSAAR